MNNYLGIDFGTKTIGLSLFEHSIKFVIGLCQMENNNHFLVELKNIIEQYKINKIVLGYPFLLNNLKSERHLLIQNFFQNLKKEFKNIDIILFDESNSTNQSLASLKKFNIKTSKLKSNKDLVSACIILENYLTSVNIL